VDLVTFTGGVAIGKAIAAKAVYKRQVLELGGNDPLIVMEDADIEEAATLATSGSYKNSGQRCNGDQADARARRMPITSRTAGAKTQGAQVRRSVDPANEMEPSSMKRRRARCKAVEDAMARRRALRFLAQPFDEVIGNRFVHEQSA